MKWTSILGAVALSIALATPAGATWYGGPGPQYKHHQRYRGRGPCGGYWWRSYWGPSWGWQGRNGGHRWFKKGPHSHRKHHRGPNGWRD